MSDTVTLFRSLGFSEGERATYLTLLEMGASNVIDITKKSKLSRQTVYNSLDTLIEKGLISTVQKGKKKNYIAEDPEKILGYVRRKEHELAEQGRDFERMLPELKLKKSTSQTTVKVFEGKEGALAVLQDVASLKASDAYEIADLDALRAFFTEADYKLIQKNLPKEKELTVKGFYVGKPLSERTNTERHFLPEEFKGFKTDVVIYANKIALLNVEGKIYSVIIENAALAHTLRILFKLALRSEK